MIRPNILEEDYKILIRSPKHSIAVQKALFKLGYTWCLGKKIQETHRKVLWCPKCKTISHSSLTYATNPSPEDEHFSWYQESSNIRYNIKYKILIIK